MVMQPIHPDLQIFTTADGSPTLIFAREDGHLEKMHHTAGALTESLYIYHHGLTMALDQGLPPRILSVGLGLAYNELIALAELHKRGRADAKIWSFEALPYLREHFAQWCRRQNESSEYSAILNQVCARISAHFQVQDLRGLAAQALDDGHLQLRGAFPHDAQGIDQVGVVFYDAFSNKMSPELWREPDVQQALSPLLNDQSLLCTYAATGALNRVLKNLGFRLLKRSRFRGKRDSTLAIRP